MRVGGLVDSFRLCIAYIEIVAFRMLMMKTLCQKFAVTTLKKQCNTPDALSQTMTSANMKCLPRHCSKAESLAVTSDSLLVPKVVELLVEEHQANQVALVEEEEVVACDEQDDDDL
eukprot:m.192357 g.192357  ORF g.192357 m.192357 type:complete len:116 (+) comp39468_c0_seq8:214-561(+)